MKMTEMLQGFSSQLLKRIILNKSYIKGIAIGTDTAWLLVFHKCVNVISQVLVMALFKLYKSYCQFCTVFRTFLSVE